MHMFVIDMYLIKSITVLLVCNPCITCRRNIYIYTHVYIHQFKINKDIKIFIHIYIYMGPDLVSHGPLTERFRLNFSDRWIGAFFDLTINDN